MIKEDTNYRHQVTSIKVSPYTCQVLYQEVEQLKSRKRTVSDFILRGDLMFISRFVEMNGELTDAQVVNVCLGKVLKIDALYSNSHIYFQQYLEGLGTINTINRHLASIGLNSLQDEIVKNNMGSSSILNYVFLSVTGRLASRNKLNIQDFKKEILNEFAMSRTIEEGQAFEAIHSRVEEINNFVQELRVANRGYDANRVLQSLEQLKVKLGSLNNDTESTDNDEEFKRVEKELLGILDQIDSNSGKMNDVEDLTRQTLGSYTAVIDEVMRRLSNEDARAVRISNHLERKAEEGEVYKTKLEILTGTLNDSISKMEQSLQSAPIEDILNLIKGYNEGMQEVQFGVKEQAIQIKEAESKLRGITEGTKVLNNVISTLNSLMRQDILLGLSKTQDNVDVITRDIEALGEKYKKWREIEQ